MNNSRGMIALCKLVLFDEKAYVADIKLKYIDNIVNQASKASNISRIMLFGSAVEDRCTEKSDIDVAVFGSMPKTRYLRSREFKEFQDSLFCFDFNQDYDILYFSDGKKQSDAIMRDINKGAEIYRRATA